MKNMIKKLELVVMLCAIPLILSLIPAAEAADGNEVTFSPNPDFGTYLGVTEDGQFEFEITITDGGELYPFPIIPFPKSIPGYGMGYYIQNSHAMCTDDYQLYGVSPGEVDITFNASYPGGRTAAEALVHVTVISQDESGEIPRKEPEHIHNWYYSIEHSTCIKGGAAVLYL